MSDIPNILKGHILKKKPKEKKELPPGRDYRGKFATGHEKVGGREKGTRNGKTVKGEINKAIAEMQKRGEIPYPTKKERIEDFRKDVYGIIDKLGLKNQEDEIKLDTALKLQPYLDPKKVSSTETRNITLTIIQAGEKKPSKSITAGKLPVEVQSEVLDN